MTETGKNWHKKLPPTLYAYAGANTFNFNCLKVSDKVDDGIMKEALLDFYTSLGKRKLDQIIIFSFDQVIEACKFLDEKWNPKDCGYCCTKSHHTKFFQQGSPDNVLHGTVIENKVCHQKNNDFYLGTHAGMIGITRQTHYHVLLDQAGFSADDLSTTTIFVVALICYAHLVASQLGAIYEDYGCFKNIIESWWDVCSGSNLCTLAFQGLTNNSQDCCWGNPFLMGL
ncbi:hypothetical protein GOBAR_AA08181 [Gossypium barbadense]|uniref:Piwi domain-containing protein n=1 Tax=Gossypium barbadense TaxID=3634 RepID=A0A2P5YA24_GOSBA|nr:hypothetical protein GOBAR_AA08181 [Gossypium barbadense]